MNIQMKDTLQAVLAPFGPSGSEGPIAAVLTQLVKPYVDEITSDALGNLICVKKGTGKRILFAAHMDSIGYIVLEAEKEGFLRVAPVGGIFVADAAFRPVTFANGVVGVVCSEPLKEEKPSMAKLFIDVGASTREEALALVPIGTMASVQYQFTDMGDRVAAPFMDARAACAVLVELLKNLGKTDNEVIAVFTTQEEVGLRGATAAAYSMQPDLGVALDVTGAGDTPKSSPLPMKVGEGPCVKVKDAASISTPLVRDGLIAAAGIASVPFQYEILPFGGTDAGAIQLSRGGIPAGTLSIACRYVHNPVETVSIRDMEQCVLLLKAYVEEVVK